MSLPLARIDDQYEIVAKIKEGGMGEIYQVRHRLLDELRVVKILHPELVGDSELNERFAREARAAIQLRHPNIVQIFDFTLDASGGGLIVMEYIRGADLKQLIAHPGLPSIALAVEIACQSLRALGYLHRNGFVHRDISPDNLMLTIDVESRPLVKIIDLGIAKRSGSDQHLTASGAFLGKFRYASPEHFGAQGSGGIEARSDLYTFGLVLYELLTGEYPIRGESTSQLIAGHLFQAPRDFSETDPNGRIPELLRRAILKTLAKEPAERFATAEELVACIEGLRVDYPLSSMVLEESRRFATDAASRAVGDSLSAPSADVVPGGVTTSRKDTIGRLVDEVEELMQSGKLIVADRHQRAIADIERRLLALIRREDFEAAKLVLTAAETELTSKAAIEPLRELLSKAIDERIQSLVKKAGVAFEAERFDVAADCLDKVLALDPGNGWIRSRLERARAGLRRQQAAIQRQVERDSRAHALVREAEQARDARDVLKARLLVAKALELNPELAEAAALARSSMKSSAIGNIAPPSSRFRACGQHRCLPV